MARDEKPPDPPLKTTVNPPSEPVVERRIGAYRVLRELGHGGMGTVYLAARADDQYQKRVAIKVVRGLDSDQIVRHFRRERQILAALDHPNIARLLDGGTTEDGLPYFVMERVEGEAIDSFCDGRKLSVQERLRLFQGVCAAVQYAHQNLVVHRDLKPKNILVDAQGVPKLLDFGIAKLLNPEISGEAATGTVLAMTPEYASPEQMRGQPITTATDVYSLGVVLYELLTHQVPFPLRGPAGDWQAAMRVVNQHIHQMPLPPHQIVPSVSADLEQVALTSLQKDIDKRYRDGHGMRQALGYRSPTVGVAPALASPQAGQDSLHRTPDAVYRFEPPVRRASQLVVLKGPGVNRQWTVTEILVLGRDDLDPQDVRVSRRHIQLEAREDGCWLQDLSANGTWINKKRVVDALRLCPGDLIAVGESVLQVQE